MKITKPCCMCGSKIVRRPSEFRGNHPVCSKECLSKRRAEMHTKEIVIKPCQICGKPVRKKPYRINFDTVCGKECNKIYSSKKLSALNKKLNPTKMTEEIKTKIREKQLGRGEGKTYTKYYGRHEHRVVAEKILGRPLLPTEVVHHKDENKKNNAEDNIKVYSSKAEHSRYHSLKRHGKL